MLDANCILNCWSKLITHTPLLDCISWYSQTLIVRALFSPATCIWIQFVVYRQNMYIVRIHGLLLSFEEIKEYICIVRSFFYFDIFEWPNILDNISVLWSTLRLVAKGSPSSHGVRDNIGFVVFGPLLGSCRKWDIGVFRLTDIIGICVDVEKIKHNVIYN